MYNAYDIISDLKSDKVTLLTGLTEQANKNNELVYIVNGLHVNEKELKKYNADLQNKLKDNDIKFKNLNSIVSTQQNIILSLKTALKDSTRITIINDTIYSDTIKCFNYSDSYNNITGCIDEDSIFTTLKAAIPLDIFIENIYKYKFLWWRWKVINYKVKVTTPNPSATITDLNLYIPN